MKGINARRIQVKLGEVWKSPNLHILLTEEDSGIKVRNSICLRLIHA
jgi:hypothetical protein